jgi:hypothetical protein
MADEKERSPEGDSTPEGYVAGEPEFVGKLPVRQDLEVIPDTNPDGSKKLGWMCSEYVGCEVYRFKHGTVWDIPLTKEDDLKVGDEIGVAGLFGGYHIMTIAKREDGELYADGDSMMATLSFNGDDRHCWVSSCLINKRAVEKLSKFTK